MSAEFTEPRAHGSLSSWDDFPVHQAAETIRHATTSDRNFYDRYYFNCHSNDGEALLIFGLGQYPNLAVQDAFAVVVSGSDHRVVRASRELGDRMDTSVGPFHVEVVRPLHELRIILDENEFGMSFDLTWNGSIPAFEEPRQYLRRHGRVYFDTMRLAQTGRWSGTIESSGRTFDVTPDSWWGVRDRSWGVRPVGEEEPAGIRTTGQMEGFWNYAPIQFDDHSILYILNEHDRVDANGRAHRELEEAVRIWNDPDREPEWLGRPEHDHVVGSGTRRIEKGLIRFPDAPEGPIEIAIEPMLDCYLMYGTGYGLEQDWRHGMYQGPLVVQGQTTNYDEIRESLFGINDQVARFTQSTGDGSHSDGSRSRVGYGLHEFFFIGGFGRYELNEWDPAP
jgi:hypothetical protein